MPKKQDEFVGIKLNKLDLINLDSHAESRHMNRSEFIKYCIFSELDRDKNEAAIKAKQSDAERIIQAIVESAKTSSVSLEKILSVGIISAKLQHAFLIAFPEKREELLKLFAEKNNG